MEKSEEFVEADGDFCLKLGGLVGPAPGEGGLLIDLVYAIGHHWFLFVGLAIE